MCNFACTPHHVRSLWRSAARSGCLPESAESAVHSGQFADFNDKQLVRGVSGSPICQATRWRAEISGRLWSLRYISWSFCSLCALQNPVPNDPWSGIYDARQPKPPCIQRIDVQTPAGNIVGDEDCLYLNVYRPSLVVESLPVVVYIHGGAFQYGSAAPSNVGPEYFMDNGKVILVTVEYRQGALGFLSSGCSVIPGNFGLKDQAMAIRWVKRYIHRFGGDPDLITVAGQSSGAASAQLHMLSPLSRGHFSRAIMMSGSALSFWAAPSKDSAYVARQQLAVLGIQSFAEMSSQDMLATLRSVEAYDLVKSIDNLKQILGIVRSLVVYGPVVEPFVKRQSFLSDDPKKLWDAGDYEPIPWLAGLLPNDGLIFSSLGYKLNADPEIWSQIVPQLPYILTASIGLDLSAATRIKSRFYPDSTSPEWLTSQNLNKLTDVSPTPSPLKPVITHNFHLLPDGNRVRLYVPVAALDPVTSAERLREERTHQLVPLQLYRTVLVRKLPVAELWTKPRNLPQR